MTAGNSSSFITRGDASRGGVALAAKPAARSLNTKRSRAPGLTFYHAAARPQPKLCRDGKGRRRINRKRAASSARRDAREEEGPQQEESDPAALASSSQRPNKKPRRVFPPADRLRASVSFLSSDLLRRRYGGVICRRSTAKAVTFAHPLVTDSWTRPRTAREDVANLFYCKADEMRFRKELCQERDRLRRLREEVSSSSDEETCRVVKTKTATTTVANAPASEHRLEDLNEVTESEDSSDSEESSSSDEEEQ